MQRFLKILVLLLLIAGLPLQNLHAIAMPLCDQGTDAAATHSQSAHDAGSADHDHVGSSHASSDTNSACDGCSQCDACSAPAIVSLAIGISLDAVDTPPTHLTSLLSLLDPEQPQRPPQQS